MVAVLDPNKTKIAKRVIEVFEYFDADHPTATVMDIVRRYDRPQSSTSELLAGLAQMGLLYKNARSRTYSPTPRLATIGADAQPRLLRDGRLYAFMDRLSHSTRHAVALFGRVGTHTQIFRWSAGPDPISGHIGCGASEFLCASAAGHLLLSTLPTDHIRRMLWRLNAEVAPEKRFDTAELGGRIAAMRRQRHASGLAGFVAGAQITAALLPLDVDEPPLTLGVVYPAGVAVDVGALVATLTRGIAQCIAPEDTMASPVASAPMMMAV